MQFRLVSVPFRGSCSEIRRVLPNDRQERDVSVPFRGSCSEISKDSELKAKLDAVSVPFRGSCSEIEYALVNRDYSPTSFRPLSGFVF